MKNHKTRFKINRGFKLLAVVLSFEFCLLSLASGASAASASLYLSPSTGTYGVGGIFSVAVKINSGGKVINAAEGNLVFNPNELRVVSFSKSGSIFSLWTTGPTFSNSIGNIIFGGGTPDNFSGTGGTIITINFRARKSGTFNVNFSSGSILAADGKGTNILANLVSGSYIIQAKVITPPAEEYVPPSTPMGTPVAPIISSPTHFEEEKWYSNNNPEFFWKLPSDVSGVSLLLHKNPTGDPGSVSDGLVDLKKFEEVEDGVWYFHIKFKNENGWGEITHRKVLIDIQSPKPFEIKLQQENPTDPQPVLLFEATDDLSGIRHYEVKIGEGDAFPITTEEVKSNPYRVPFQAPGFRSISVSAFDKANNFTSAFADIEVLPIEKPKILKILKRIRAGEILIVEGTSLPEVKIIVFVQKGGKEPFFDEIRSDSQGKWKLFYDKALTVGDYNFWAQARDKRGALSYPTERYPFEVGLPPFLKFGKIVIDYLNIMVTLIVLLVGAIAVIFYIWHRISIWKLRVRKETKEAEEKFHRAFLALREEIEEQVAKLDGKKGLSRKEKQICDKLKESLRIAEEFVGKEIKDIEKELE